MNFFKFNEWTNCTISKICIEGKDMIFSCLKWGLQLSGWYTFTNILRHFFCITNRSCLYCDPTLLYHNLTRHVHMRTMQTVHNHDAYLIWVYLEHKQIEISVILCSQHILSNLHVCQSLFLVFNYLTSSMLYFLLTTLNI